ncbi:MAG: thiamine biosynthesis lipoprotein [Gammaproteobacteria bacterium]
MNFGGDLAANRPQLNHQSWLVEYINEVKKSLFFSGGVATSGDTERYLLRDGVRYSHCLYANNV